MGKWGSARIDVSGLLSTTCFCGLHKYFTDVLADGVSEREEMRASDPSGLQLREPERRSGATCSFSLDPQVPTDHENVALYLLIRLTLLAVLSLQFFPAHLFSL